jgi:hypothetical protein
MGLTINYKLSAREDWPSAKVRQWLEIIADYARHLGCESVGDIQDAVMRPDVTEVRFEKAAKLQKKSAYAEEGWLITIQTGDGCEPLILGLCKYPQSRSAWNGHRSTAVPSGLPHGWTFAWFCKTQFAGKHGPAHFVRCHKSVISLLDFSRKAGLDVTVQDEAGYWENRDEGALLTVLRRNEAMLAAFGGLLKDMTDKTRGPKIKSPIFEYADFEHLEHEGWERFGKYFAPFKNCGRQR